MLQYKDNCTAKFLRKQYMKIKLCKWIIFGWVLFQFGSCNFSNNKSNAAITTTDSNTISYKHIMSKEEQDALTPDGVLQEFIAGNERFRKNDLTKRPHSEAIRKAVTGGQFPKAMVLSCLDSRVPVEDVFDQGLGDVFVGRVAGNFVNTDLLGSMEFACKVAGAKLILVMGHQHCGAVKGAIDNVEMGNITHMLANIKPAVMLSAKYKGEKSSANEQYVKVVAQHNVLNTIAQIRKRSPILKQMEDNGQIKIVGAFYTLRTGELQFLN